MEQVTINFEAGYAIAELDRQLAEAKRLKGVA